MPDSPDTLRLLELCRAGDGEAARQLYHCYVDRLVAVARRRLGPPLQSRVDPEDIVQSVFRTFFGRLKAGKFRLEEQDDVCKLLVRITVNKTLRQVAYQKAAKRDPGQEAGQEDPGRERLLELMAREPDPEAAAAFVDQLQAFLANQLPQDRRVLLLRLQGYGTDEIARQLGVADRTVRRVLERIKGQALQEDWLA
jgi:RNA polymerase sigma-70 factor (ECF subfamily)